MALLPDDLFFRVPPSEVRQSPGYRIPVRKPQSVQGQAARANAIISRLAAGDRAGAEALVSEADLARRKGAAQERLGAEEYQRRLDAALTAHATAEARATGDRPEGDAGESAA